MSTKGLMKKLFLCVLLALMSAVVFSACEVQDPVEESTYYINDNNENYYNKDHTTTDEAVDEFTDSITALRKYLDSESFVDSGYYMGVDFDIDILDFDGNTKGNFALHIQAYLYTYPYEDEDGNPIYKYYENGKFYDENNEQGTRTLISALEIHNEAIKKSDICIEWYNGATNEVLIGLYFDGVNNNAENPGNILYANIQGYKRSFPDFGDTVLYQQMVRLLVNLSVEGLLQAAGLQGDAGVGGINTTLKTLIGDNFKRVVNGDLISLLFYSVTLDAISNNVNDLLYRLFGPFGEKWDPMTSKFLGFQFSTVANALVQKIDADMHAIIAPEKNRVNNVLTNAAFAFAGLVESNAEQFNYTSHVRFDYAWTYPDELTLDMNYYTPFDYGNYEFDGTLYIPAWDAQYDAEIKTDMNPYDNSTNNVFMEFRDIANGELMIGVYYRDERAYLDITGLSYMYGWIDLEYLGFPQVYDEHLDLADVLNKFNKLINRVIVSIVDAIIDPASSDKENKALEYILAKTYFTKKIEGDIFSANTETLQLDIELVKQMLEETGVGTFSTRQIITILDSMMPYTMDQIAIMLGIASAEIMLEKTYFLLTWDVDTQEITIDMFTNVGVNVEAGEPSVEIFRLELIPVHFGEYVSITMLDFSGYKPLEEIYTYSGTLRGNFIFSSQEIVDLSKLLSATIGESSGLNTPYTLPQNVGLSFTLIYDQFVKDQYADGRWKLAGRSAFELNVWITGEDSTIILGLASDDVSFNNEVYKNLPEREDELGYIWVNIACVTKNGTQVIPKVKIREDVFMASMSAYMNNQTSIEDDVMSFADNDFNLSLTSIITALCKDAYVIPAADQLEITSSNDTLKSLFRVNGLIGNIKVNAGFTYRVKGLESIRKQYYMYEVGFFENISGNSPYDTPLHKTLDTFFYEDYRDDYDPLQYDFLVYADNVFTNEDATSFIQKGTIYLYQLGARRTVSRQEIEYSSSSFFNEEDDNNQDITKVRFVISDLILDPTSPLKTEPDNMLVYKIDDEYYYRTYYGRQKKIDKEKYIYVSDDGTEYVYWLGIEEVLFHDSGADYYFFDRNRALLDEDGNQIFIKRTTERELLFEYDPDSVLITEACKTQYAPRTNGSFMGEVRRYFVTFESHDSGELGVIQDLYYDATTGYPKYYSYGDETYVVEVYDKDGVLLSSTLTPIMLFVMEPCEPLAETARVQVKTSSVTTQLKSFDAQFVFPDNNPYDDKSGWDYVSEDKKGYMLVTEVRIAPGMMGETVFPVRIIILNREVDTRDYVSVYTTADGSFESAPVVDEIDVDPYEYAMEKYEYLSDIANLNLAFIHNNNDIMNAYKEAATAFSTMYFSYYCFNISFAYQNSYLYLNNVGTDVDKDTELTDEERANLKSYDHEYVQKSYSNASDNTITRFDWYFDVNEVGSNQETLISPDGGTLYLHSYFHGQLIALKVNVGKRDFVRLKFYDTDEFSPSSYNADNLENDPYIIGLYRGNYYDEGTYAVDTRPIFVFTDGSREYDYVFDMRVLKGLAKNNDGSYAGTYIVQDSYELVWGNGTITNITSDGSAYKEYAYEHLFKSGDNDFILLNKSYSSLTGEELDRLVPVYNAGTVTYMRLYKRNDEDGRAMQREQLKYSELMAMMTDAEQEANQNEAFQIAYGTGIAPKFASDRYQNAVVRVKDVQDASSMEEINRPYYFFYRTGYFYLNNGNENSADNPVLLTAAEYQKYMENDVDIRKKYAYHEAESSFVYLSEAEYEAYMTWTSGIGARSAAPQYTDVMYAGIDLPVYLTADEYTDYLSGTLEYMTKYAFDSVNTSSITTSGLDLFYLFRLYYTLVEKNESGQDESVMYAISTLENRILTPSEIANQTMSTIGFNVVELCIEVECPKLEISQQEGLVYDDFGGFKFDINTVQMTSPDPKMKNPVGYYYVNPLKEQTFYLPDSAEVFFTFNGGKSSHVFHGLQWYVEGDYGTLTLLETVEEDGYTLYKVAIDLSEIKEEMVFRAKAKIGNDISGYRDISVAIKILSTEPTDISFYINDTEKLNIPSITAEYDGLLGSKKSVYYSYFVNTFDNFKLPTRLVATFNSDSGDNVQEYVPEWRAAKAGFNYVFTPDTVVVLVTTIGTANGVNIDIYLAVIVENNRLEEMSLPTNDNFFKTYYVTVETSGGDKLTDNVTGKELKKSLYELFNLSGSTLSYNTGNIGGSTYYIHISTGSEDEKDTPAGQIALYTLEYNDRGDPVYRWAENWTVYDLVAKLYSRATVVVSKSEINMNKQAIINAKDSIKNYEIVLQSNDGGYSERTVKIGSVLAIDYVRQITGVDEQGNNIYGESFDVSLKLKDGSETFYPKENDNGTLTIFYGAGTGTEVSREISYSELAVYILNESFAEKYVDWRVVSVGGSTYDANGQELVQSTLSDYVRYNNETQNVEYIKVNFKESDEIVLKNSTNATVTMSYHELTYRLNYYFRYLRVVSGSTAKITNKDISIRNLYEIMDIRDMLVREVDNDDPNDRIPTEKYVIGLGTGIGAYDIEAYLMFTGGKYLTLDEKAVRLSEIAIYSSNGSAKFAEDYVLGNEISLTVKPITNKTGVTSATDTAISYNKAANDARLVTWYVEEAPEGFDDIIKVGDLITKLPASQIYASGDRSILLSTLTPEGFRITMRLVFERINENASSFSGGNANLDFDKSKKFVIDNGVITVDNIYQFANDKEGIKEYFATNKYLPTTIYYTMDLSGRMTISNVQWKLDMSWYGNPESAVERLNYSGVGLSVMATAQILGYTDGAGETRGTTLITLRIIIKSAEVTVLPWDTATKGNGLSTETLKAATSVSYKVYVDAYGDKTAKTKKAIVADEDKDTYLSLETSTAMPFIVQYADGSNIEFTNVSFMYGQRKITRLYFDYRGIDIVTMVSSKGDLAGLSASMFSEREIELSVALGLGQTLNITFYFYNKRIEELDSAVYYSVYLSEDGEKFLYSDLPDEQKELCIGDTEYKVFGQNDDGYVTVANLMYYYEPYYVDGNQPYYEYLTEAQKQEKVVNTDINVYVSGDTGMAMKISFLLNDIMAVVGLDDKTVRDAIAEEQQKILTSYRTDLVNQVNLIRVEENLKNIIDIAQAIRSTIKQKMDNVTVSTGVAQTTADISAIFLSWTLGEGGLKVSPTYNENTLPTGDIYSYEEAYNYALAAFIEEATKLAYHNDEGNGEYVTAYKNILNGADRDKVSNLKKTLANYFDDFTKNAMNAMVRVVVEKEYTGLFMEEINGFTPEQYNNAVYYKNMIEAGIDEDAILSDIYKLRSFYSNDPTGKYIELAAQQLKITKALKEGYGYVMSYEPFMFGGSYVGYSELSDEQKNEKFSIGSSQEVLMYKNLEGRAGKVTLKMTYESLAYAIVMQAIMNAYDYADSKISDNNKDENWLVIKETVIRLFEQRLNVEAFRFYGAALGVEGGKQSEGTTAKHYTIESFVGNYVFNTTASNLTKKVMRAYIANCIVDAMDFTALSVTEWNEFIAIKYNVIAHYYGTITNYKQMINTVRKGLISGTSVTAKLTNLISSGIKTFTSNIYAEQMYVETIRNMQKLNGEIIDPVRFGYDDENKLIPVTLNEFAKKVNENTEMYLIEPYYLFRSTPHNIAVFFKGNDTYEDGRFRDESGRVYVTTITWATDTVKDSVSYLGNTGVLVGSVGSNITGDAQVIHMAAATVVRYVEADDVVITTKYIIDGLGQSFSGGVGKLTSDGRYYMFEQAIDATEGTYMIRYYRYDSSVGTPGQEITDGDYSGRPIKYILNYRIIDGKKKMEEFSGYDSNVTIVYTLVNTYRTKDNGRIATDQALYVYNPFEFSVSSDMPDIIVLGDSTLNVIWSNLGVTPLGSGDATQAIVKGTIGSSAGQEVSMSVYVAKWSYAGIYRATDIDTGFTFSVEGVDVGFIYMNPMNFFFSAYTTYSPEDYYLVQFAVKMLLPDDGGNMVERRIIFKKQNDSDEVIGIEIQDKDEGFVRKIFYPENSRLLEYSTSDDTMSIVKARRQYVIYWEETSKNKVIGTQAAQIKDCLIYLGNDRLGQYSLGALKDSNDVTAPTKAIYGCEKMSIDKTGFISLETPSGNQTVDDLYAEIKDILIAGNGQAPIVVAPDTYLPTTGTVILKENNIHYNPDELSVRFLWNISYEKAIDNLSAFVKAMYSDIEDSMLKDYSRNMLLSWDKKSEAEKEEIIGLAVEYMWTKNQYTIGYDDAQALRDAYDLLVINERYNYAKDINRLRGGANNNIIVNIAIGVEDSTAVYVGSAIVKVLFADYTPIEYLDITGVQKITNGLNVSKAEDLENIGLDALYIGVRAEYWNDGVSYLTDGKNMAVPYDKIGDDMYKLLQIFSELNATDVNGVLRKTSGEDGVDKIYYIEVTKIVWETVLNDKNQPVGIRSSSFVINGTEYKSDLLYLPINVTGTDSAN